MRPLRLLGLLAVIVTLIGSACGSAPPGQKVEAALASSAPRELTPEEATTTSTVPPTPPTTRATVAPKPAPHPARQRASRSVMGSGHCGGDLPPCWVMNRESGGNLNAYNPTGCSGRGCYGKWQCDPRTCSGHGTEEQQDAEARALWNNGKGCSHWDAC